MNLNAPPVSCRRPLLSLLAALLLFAGCSSTRPAASDDATTSATLWMQNAAEYEALSLMVYQAATDELGSALQVDSWTASLEQQTHTGYRDLPPVVVLDVDETVLDNSPFQARLIKQNASYTTERWNRWVREARAGAVAGALAFTRKAHEMGITVFYLTNRESVVEEATYRNLRELGFPLKEGTDVLLTKNERPEWTSAKVNRRKYLAARYRILMLFGDNLNDFLPAEDLSGDERRQLVEAHKERFGSQWFVLPNPVYGSWESALYHGLEDPTEAERQRRKMEKLDTKSQRQP